MIGKKISHYNVTEKLGAGGMGEVYRATDTKLNRDVALKVLPEEFARDAQRMARFKREAQVLASLNHPNIAAIYGLEQEGDTQAIALELVEGPTLAERIAQGPLPLKEALEMARQIAEALEAAHEKGVIHRDLKPANVKIKEDGPAAGGAGTVKVLDFGLAKALEPLKGETTLDHSPTVSEAATLAGTLLGTVAYMSPEQARAKPADRRADIWAFGVVLFEMLTGQRPFRGGTVSDIITSILSREPDWGELPAKIPPPVRRVLRRCLAKNTKDRLHHIADARIELDEVLSGSAPGDETAAEAVGNLSRLAGWMWGAVALAGVLLGAAASYVLFGTAPGQGTSRTLVQAARMTHDAGHSEWPSWSPDGSLLAFSSNRSGNFDIYVRRVDGGQEVNITNNPGDDFQPAFSPDGTSVAFVSTRSSRTGMIRIGASVGMEFRTFGGDLWVAPALGGQARRLAENANFPVWEPSGEKIAYVTGPEGHRAILEVTADGAPVGAVLPSEESKWEIVGMQYSPDSSWLSFDTSDERAWLMPARGGTPREVGAGSSHVWDPDGRRMYYLVRDAMGGTLLQSVEIDPGSGEVLGPPQAVGLMTGVLRNLAISRDGRRFAISELEGSLNLTRLPLSPGTFTPAGPEEELSSGQVIDRYPRFSPDGRRIAYGSDRLGLAEIWVLDTETKRAERLELPGDDLGANIPYWSPDGHQLVVTRFYPDGTRSVWLAAPDGSHAEEILSPARGQQSGPFSPDGRSLLYVATGSESFHQIFVLDLESRQSRQLTFSPGDKAVPEWTQDGRHVIFVSSSGELSRILRVPSEGGEAEVLISGYERQRHQFYSPDGQWILFQPSHRNIHRMPAAGGPSQPVTTFPESGLFIEEPALSPDGRWLAYCRSRGGSSLWVLTVGDR